MSAAWRIVGVLVGVLAAAGCSSQHALNDTLDRLDSENIVRRRNKSADVAATPAIDAAARSLPQTQRTTLFEMKGNGEFARDTERSRSAAVWSDNEGRVTVNLVDAPIRLAAKAVLSDQLRLNYVVSERTDGKITLQTSSPVNRTALFDAFEAALKLTGATITEKNGTYWISAASDSIRAGDVTVGSTPSMRPGAGVQVVPLRYVSARALASLIEPLLPKGSLLRADDTRNILILNGSRTEVSSALETIAAFDVDWMKGMSFAMIAVETSEPDTIVAEVEKALGFDRGGPLRNVLRLIPNKRLRSVLVVAPQREHIERARKLIEQYDRIAEQRDKRLFVYKVRNRSAAELADVLRKVLANASAPKTTRADDSSASAGGQVAPRFAATELAGSTDRGQRAAVDPRAITAENQNQSEPTPVAAQAQDTSAASDRVTVVADESANALLIQTYPAEYRKVLRMLDELDATPTQVLIEAVIAEVTLNDELKFGVKWHLKNKASSATFTDAAQALIGPSFPGFSYFLNMSNIQVALDALSGVTKINVVSAPSLMVMDGRKANLQVGDQVPIVTQTTQGVSQPGAPVVNSVTMKDTGVILNVTPRVNTAGRVVLDIEQEVSSVARTTTSGIDSPTIQQRKIKTTLTVSDGEVVALGGLIQRRDSVGQTQVPILGNVPVLGTIFRQREDFRDRTELIIFIRPQVIRDVHEGRRISQEYQERLERIRPDPLPRGNPPLRDLTRIIR